MIFQKSCSRRSGFWPPCPPLSSTSFVFCLQQMGPIFAEMESIFLARDCGLSILIVVVVVVIIISTLPTSKNCLRSFSWIQQNLSTTLKCKNFLTEGVVVICNLQCHTSNWSSLFLVHIWYSINVLEVRISGFGFHINHLSVDYLCYTRWPDYLPFLGPGLGQLMDSWLIPCLFN